jgi:hypothetical protein
MHKNLTANPGLLVPNTKKLAVFILRMPMLENLRVTNKVWSCGGQGMGTGLHKS